MAEQTKVAERPDIESIQAYVDSGLSSMAPENYHKFLPCPTLWTGARDLSEYALRLEQALRDVLKETRKRGPFAASAVGSGLTVGAIERIIRETGIKL